MGTRFATCSGRWADFRVPPAVPTLARHREFPAVNLYDASDRYVLTAELPGMASEDLELSITGETRPSAASGSGPKGSPTTVIAASSVRPAGGRGP